ncbi:MAG: hypothetical protein JSU68_13450 [Phycisphaerales bacterium]|nr:MAG: hypothetical protein JSU68_13450 [Phycisphaerales bacterium]
MLPTTQNLIPMATGLLTDVYCVKSACRVSDFVTREFHGLWPMVGLLGAALMLAGLFQAFRRKPFTAIFALLIGGLGLGVFLSLTRTESRSITAVFDVVRRPMVVRRAPPAPRPPLAERPPEPLIDEKYALVNQVSRLGDKYHKLPAKKLAHSFECEDTVCGVSDVHKSADDAKEQAFGRVAERLRRQYLPKIAENSRIPADKIEEHAEDIDKVIAEVLRGLSKSGRVEIASEEWGTPADPRHRAAVRVFPEKLARELRATITDFVETELTPLMRRTAGTLLSMFALCILLYLAYVFVDTGTRGHFTRTLRVAAALAFVGICGALWYLGA